MPAPGRERARLRVPLGVGVLAAAGVAVLSVRDPHEAGAYGSCPFLALTGRPCPGCGGLRAVHDLTRGDLAGAVDSNLLVVGLVMAAAVLWATWVVRRARRAAGPVVSDATLGVVLVVALAFGVLRNTAWGAALAP